MPATRLSRGLVSLAASAIAAVYTAGYVHTQTADDMLGGAGAVTASNAATATPAPMLTLIPASSPTSAIAAAVTTPTPIVITDAAVEQYADLHHISWDDARAQMEAAAGLTHAATPSSSDAAPTASPVSVAERTVAAPAREVVATPASAARVPTAPPRTPVSVPTAPASAVRASTATPVTRVVPAAPTSAAVAAFKDGTYTGVGTSRRGDVQVSLAVQGGRIASVSITAATTQYPTRFIAGLPAQVVSRQSAQVDMVSGATYSALAFRGAVQQALQRAQS